MTREAGLSYVRRNLGVTLALALLTAGCALLGVAGPRLALATQTHALDTLLAGTPGLSQSLQVSGPWTDITTDLANADQSSPLQESLTDADVSATTAQLRADFTAGPVQPAPLDQAWAGLTSNEFAVPASFPGVHGEKATIELVYRSPLTSYTMLVAGQYPELPPPAASPAPGGAARPPYLEVAVSRPTAARFGLRVGSTIRPAVPGFGATTPLELRVTGIIDQRRPGSAFWAFNPTAAVPEETEANGNPPVWIGAVFVSSAEVVALQRMMGPQLTFTWYLPLSLGNVRGTQAQQLYDILNRDTTQSPTLPPALGPAQDALSVSTGLVQPLRGFLATQTAVGTLQWLLFASLGLTAIVVLLLAGRMVAARRAPELAVLRARGAALRQVAWVVLRDALAACGPATALAVLAAILIVPGETPAGALAWWPGVAVLLVAACGPAISGAWPLRPPRRRRGLRPASAQRARRARLAARLVAEVTLCALALAALIVLREHGASTANLLTGTVPALVAIPVVVVEQWLYPLALRAALRLAARGRNATAFLALSGAARTALTPALPTFALVLALTVAAFGGMTRSAITSGDIAASWRAVGADVSVNAGVGLTSGAYTTTGDIPPAAARAVAAVPGVQHATAVLEASWETTGGLDVTGIAVDPASYAALSASAGGYWPAFPASTLAGHGPAIPVLVNPAAAAQLGPGAVALTSPTAQGITVRVAGLVASTPALPGVSAFIIMPISALRPVAGTIEPNLMLLTGPAIDRARLSAVVARTLPGSVTTYRSDQLAALTSAALQHGTFTLFAIGTWAAAGLGLTVLLLVLALGAAARELALARLATMGLSGRQRAWLVLLEVGPAVLAAAVAGVACALLLPAELGPVLDLSAFTGSGTPVPFAADALSVAAPIAGLAVLAVIALAIEMRAGRRLGVAARMRGES
jgi:putative ABC transport system permease protein